MWEGVVRELQERHIREPVSGCEVPDVCSSKRVRSPVVILQCQLALTAPRALFLYANLFRWDLTFFLPDLPCYGIPWI